MAWENLLTIGSPYTYTLNDFQPGLEISGDYLQSVGYSADIAINTFPDDEGDYGYESSQVATDESLTISVPTGTNVRVTLVASDFSGITSGGLEFLLVSSAAQTVNNTVVGFNTDGENVGYALTDLYTVPVELATSGGQTYMRFFVSSFSSPTGDARFRLLIEVQTDTVDEFWTGEINSTETV